MAYYTKSKAGWRVQIERRGVRKSRTFITKAAAQAWAAQEERAIVDGEVSRWPAKTVAQALQRYAEEVSPTKRGGRAEGLRLVAFERDFPALASRIISDVETQDLAGWRDARLKVVTPGSVQRDISLLRNVWTLAGREWGWCALHSPWSKLRMPGDNPPRDRLIGWREAKRIVRRCGYVTGQRPNTTQQGVAWAFMVSLRTGMRAGEILGLSGESVDLKNRVVTLDKHKTSEHVGKRLVPLTPQGARLLSVLHKPGPLFDVKAGSLDALFRKMRDSVLLDDIHFHDARSAALTHLARKVDVMTLARISGHKNLSLLLSTYYRETAAAIAQRLAAPRPSHRPQASAASSG
jgi:integrase